MTDNSEAGAADARPEPPRPQDDSILGSVERLVESGKELAEAELAWAKIKGRGIAHVVRQGVFFASVALVCLTVGLALLLVAAVIALAPLTGLLAATLIVSAGSLVGAGLFGLGARRVFKRLIEDETA